MKIPFNKPLISGKELNYISEAVAENNWLATNTILEVLRAEYPNEKCVSYKNIMVYLQSLSVCGLIDMELTGYFDYHSTPIKRISITDYGKSKTNFTFRWF